MRPKSRVLAFLASIALLLGVVTVASPATAANSTLCSGYAACTAAGYSTHGYETVSGTSYWGMIPGPNCTNYAARVQNLNGVPNKSGLGNANTWGPNASAQGVPVNNTPHAGAVAWWSAYASGYGGDGHVAYVEFYGGNYILISEDIYPSGPFRWRRIDQGTSAWPTGFIHFKDVPLKATSHGTADFNGDGKSDFVTFVGNQFTVKSGVSPHGYVAQGVTLGGPGNTPLLGRFNNDSVSDFVIYAGGQWAVRSGANPYPMIAQGISLGGPNSTPHLGDFNNDGKSDFAVFSSGTWAVRSGVSPYDYIAQGVTMGGTLSKSLVGRFNNDNISDFVTYDGGQWAVRSGAAPYPYLAQGVALGGLYDTPLMDDFNLDGRGDFVLFGGGIWAVKSGLHPNPMVAQGISLGYGESIPFVGRFDTGSMPDFAVYTNGTWAVRSGASPNVFLAQGVSLGGTGHAPATR